jgi:hypothetical protein
MNRTDVQRVLAFIEGFERRAFPASAVDAWLAIMAPLQVADVMQAAVEHFDSAEPIQGGVQPGPLKRRAIVIAEVRERAAKRAIEPASSYTPPNDEYRRAMAELVARFGDASRPATSATVRRRPMRANTTHPTSADSEITEQHRAASLHRLARVA